MAAHDIYLGAAGATPDKTYIEDFFSTYLYTGNGTSQTINNGIDLAGEGGMVWIKSRLETWDHQVIDTVRGATKPLYTNTTDGQQTRTTGLTAFSGTGFSIGADLNYNKSAITYTSWTFRKAPKFFDVVTYTGNGSNRTISHSLGSVPGMIIVKRTDATGGDWQVYHRSNANTQYMVLNTNAAVTTGATRWNSTTPTSSVFSLGTDSTVNASGGTYVAYLFAHDTTTDGLIQCGSFTADSSGKASIELGWEPQYILFKGSNATNYWTVVDNMRGWSQSGSWVIYPNTADPDAGPTTTNGGTLRPTGIDMVVPSGAANKTFIYMAIRRGPMRTPTDGTKVFSPLTYTASTGTARTTGFPVDLQIKTTRAVGFGRYFTDRLRGVQTTTTATTMPFFTAPGSGVEGTSNTVTNNWGNTGYADASLFSGYSEIDWNFRRAPSFFDTVCYTGTGVARTVNHNLGVAPDLMIIKCRTSSGTNWIVYASPLGASKALLFNTNQAAATNNSYFAATAPTATVFTVGSGLQTGGSGDNFVTYLFASCPGVSKVGSYTGTGAAQDINCGFTTGSRFVLIKRTDSTGDWYVWDSARGITSGNDPYSLMNTTAAETTSTNYINQLSTGFTITSTAPAAINANGGTFVYLAIA